MTAQLPVAVDAMGGDNAPETIVEGAKLAAEQFGLSVLLVGDPEVIGRYLPSDLEKVKVKPASQVIGMGAEPASSVRKLRDSSIVRGAEAVRDGEACALLGAGNTGAMMAASLLRMGRIRGVSRPAIALPFPVLGATPTTLLDVGANADCQPEWLVQFAILGAAYNRSRFGVKRPRVGILSIGEEAGKGNILVKEAAALLEDPVWADKLDVEYVGNVEGNELMSGVVDVLVCDGYTGNVVLKTAEGLSALSERAARHALSDTDRPAEAIAALSPLWHTLDSGNIGAAMLLGTRGIAMVSHGSAPATSIANAINTASSLSNANIIDDLRLAIGQKA